MSKSERGNFSSSNSILLKFLTVKNKNQTIKVKVNQKFLLNFDSEAINPNLSLVLKGKKYVYILFKILKFLDIEEISITNWEGPENK